MKKNNYAVELTKKYLINVLNITEVTKSGEIYVGGKLQKPKLDKNTGYLYIDIYSPEIYKIMYPVTGSQSSGTVKLLVHRAVFAWNSENEKIKSGFVIDHKNDDKTDNNFDNLREVLPGENIWKHRTCHERFIKCRLDKPIDFYVNKLNYYKAEYEKAKYDENLSKLDRKIKVHKLRSYISTYEAKIRYYLFCTTDYAELEKLK